jgi:hypothetical protein
MISCTNQLAPGDEELFAYITDDELLNEENLSHLQSCPICQQRLKDYRDLHQRMLSRLYRADCPEPTELMLYIEHLLSFDEVSTINTHLQTCRLCSEEVAEMRAGLANFNPFPEIPLRERILTILREGMKIFFAQLTTQTRLLGREGKEMVLRQDASAPLPSWPLHYQAGQYKLSFQLKRIQRDSLRLIGMFEDLSLEQIQPLKGVAVDLYHAFPLDANEEEAFEETLPPLMSTTVDEEGNFLFSAIAPGNYLVVLRLPGIELIVEGLSIT